MDTLPERTATPAGLAVEAAGMQRALAGCPLPRTLHALCEQAARLLPCDRCGQHPSRPCTRGARGGGYHLARFAAARRRGLVTAAEMDRLLDAAGVVFTSGTIVWDEGR